jgi:NADPH:quinone reductase-like Zn-dependent oxidoreductase
MMFTRSLYETEDMIEQHRLLAEVARLVDEGELVSTLTTPLGPLTVNNLAEAHLRLEGGRTIGKIGLSGITA